MNTANKKRIQAVPTNIITGFLGAGKTTAILHLLKYKPDAERWAILVNEFGETGIDGALMQGQSAEKAGVYIGEVAGGCMCCTAGVSMQVTLNQLLSQSRPDRLLIEPTGLGHPQEVLNILAKQQDLDVLCIQKTITLVDARQLSDPRYTENETFQQQIAVADVIVGNKKDTYQQFDYENLERYVHQHALPHATVLTSEHGMIAFAYLDGLCGAVSSDENRLEQPFEPGPHKNILNSIGWRFNGDQVFSQTKLHAFLTNLDADRVKGVFKTNEGTIGYNIAHESVEKTELPDYPESRIKIISRKTSTDWKKRLLECVI